ncbi:hypothetical protein ACPUER_36505, partial [Burkholderia sp. DN3021]|uniref:hypothetical protein n=1 Tax=Burkholderia sp. DN3021 TaxID=3410137 RepID=UPI003C7BDBA3
VRREARAALRLARAHFASAAGRARRAATLRFIRHFLNDMRRSRGDTERTPWTNPGRPICDATKRR